MAKTRRFRKGGTLSKSYKEKIKNFKETQKKFEEAKKILEKTLFAEKIQSQFHKRQTLKKNAATKLQSLNRGKTTRKHTKRLELYKKLPDELQSVVEKKYKSIDVLKRENNELLLEGAEEGNLRKVKYALDNYADIEAEEDEYNGDTALTIAAWNGNIEIVKFLLEKGADVDASDGDGYENYGTPLHFAVYYDYPEIVQLLINAGANTEISCENPNLPIEEPFHGTPLLWAAHEGNLDMLKLLIKNRVNINAITTNFYFEFDGEYIDYLHYCGNYDALQVAAIKNHINIVDYLIKQHKKHFTKSSLDHALIFAVIENNYNIAELLIKNGANVNMVSGDYIYSYSPIHSASEQGNLEILKLLINNGANIEAEKDSFPPTPLQLAIKNNKIDIVKELLKLDANIDEYALSTAKYKGNTEIITLLEKAQKRAQKKLTKSRTPKYKDRRRKIQPDFDRSRRSAKGRKTHRH